MGQPVCCPEEGFLAWGWAGYERAQSFTLGLNHAFAIHRLGASGSSPGKWGNACSPDRDVMGMRSSRERAGDSRDFQAVNGSSLLLGRVPSYTMLYAPSLRGIVQSSQPAAGSHVDGMEVLKGPGLAHSSGASPLCPDPPPYAVKGEQATARLPGLRGRPNHSESPGPSGPQGAQPRKRPQERGWRASEWLRGHRPQRLCARREGGPGAGSPRSPRMICHCLMRLISPGGWYAGGWGSH